MDYLHKASRVLVNRYAGFAVETLRLRGLMRTRLAKSFADAGLAKFLRVLRYKAEWAGREWRTLEAFTRSTGVCPDCGLTGERLPLAVREWRCTGCGAVHDRDVAAARVVLIRAVRRGTPELAGTVQRKRGIAARGGAGARASASHGGSPSNTAEAQRFVGKQ
jgi:IS605 OrfB family transposase